MVIISKAYAQRLVHIGKARLGGQTTDAPRWSERYSGHIYTIVDRLDLHRVDHFEDVERA